jgi:hypothetical protein
MGGLILPVLVMMGYMLLCRSCSTDRDNGR